MIQPAFEIGSSSLAALPEECRLLVEISGQSLNYILYTKDPHRLFLLRQYRMYTSGDRTVRDILDEIITGDPVLTHYAQNAMVIYNFPGADLVPFEHYSADIKNTVARLITGDTESDMVFEEKVTGWNMHNIYRVSKEIHAICKDKFRDSQQWHLYTLVLQSINREHLINGNIAKIIFYNDKFIVAYFHNKKLQLLQTFTYQTPEDVAYYLLLICKQFGISQQEMIVNISGLIDVQSALYTELLKYFAEVQYEEFPESFGTDNMLEEFPEHYFSPMLKMSLCV
jgi:hypothetical protein